MTNEHIKNLSKLPDIIHSHHFPFLKLGITEASLGNTNFTSPRPLASKVFDIPPQGTSAAVGEVSTSTARLDFVLIANVLFDHS